MNTSCINDRLASTISLESLQFKRWFLTAEMFSAISAAQNSWILESSWALADFIRVVDVALPDRSYLVATLRSLARWERVIALPGKLIAVIWYLQSCSSCPCCPGQSLVDHFEPQLLWLQRKSVRTRVLQSVCWAARWTARHCTYLLHGFGVCCGMHQSKWNSLNY